MLKIQCKCGHRMAVPETYAGKRVKCAQCKSAVAVPGRAAAGHARVAPAAAAIAAPAAAASPARQHRSRRHALERKQKSHNATVAMIAGAMVVIGLGLLLFIGSMNRPVEPPAPNPLASAQGKTGVQSPSGIPLTKKADTADSMTGGRERTGESETTTHVTAATPARPIAGTTSTFDADAGMTTLKSEPMPFTVADKTLQMSVTVTHDGRDIRTATQISAVMHITGDFTGIVSGADTDDPRLAIEAGGKDEFYLPPTGRDKGDDRKGENGAEILPKWVEFTLGKAELLVIADSDPIRLRTTLGGMIFNFTQAQRTLLRAIVGLEGAAPGEDPAPPSRDDADDKPGSTEPGAAAGEDVGDAPPEKEQMDEKDKEMMKK